jgi:hypothetical protein
MLKRQLFSDNLIPFPIKNATVGGRGNHRHRLAPTNAQINLEVVAIIFEIDIDYDRTIQNQPTRNQQNSQKIS